MITTNKISVFLKKYFIAFEMLLVWACIWFVMRYISIYFDDFGNITLTYLDEYYPVGSTGTNWTFSQLIEWETITYQNFGGRVIYSAFLCLLMKVNPVLYHFVTSLLLTVTFYFFYKIISLFVSKSKAIFTPLFMLCLFFCIPQVYKRECIYWASASVLYIWPCAPLSVVLYLFFNFFKKENSKMMTISTLIIAPLLCLFASVSQETFGVAILVIIVALFVLHLKQFKTNKHFYILTIVSFLFTLGGTLFVLLSPGNMARADSGVHGDFFSLSFFEKIVLNIPIITRDISFNNYVLASIYAALLICISIYMIKNEKIVFKIVLNVISVLIIVITTIFFHFNQTIPFAVAVLIVANQIYVITNFYLIKKQYCLLSLAAGMYVIAYSLTLSPVAEIRPTVPFIMIQVLFITINLFFAYEKMPTLISKKNSECVSGKLSIINKLFIVGFSALGILGCGTMISEHAGYKENYYIDQLNFKNIKTAYEDNQSFTYCFMNVGIYRSTQPYDHPMYTDRINKWIKNYLSIDQSFDIRWVDDCGLRNKGQYHSTDDFVTTAHISGIYSYEPGIDGWWTNRAFSFVINDIESASFYHHFGFENDMTIFINGNYYKNIHINGNCIFDVSFDDAVMNNKNNHILFVLSNSQKPTGGDLRELGVVIKSIQ